MKNERVLLILAGLLLMATQALGANENIISPNQTSVPEKTAVSLNASGNAQGCSYLWEQTGGLDYPVTLTLAGKSSRKLEFIAPEVGPKGAELQFTLSVTGNSCATAGTYPAFVKVTNSGNTEPKALFTVYRGSETVAAVEEGDLVTLDGRPSFDPDGDNLSYAWVQIGEPKVTLDGSSSPVATFTAPNNTASTNGVTLAFQLTVSDGYLTSYVSHEVTVKWVNDPPQAALNCPPKVNEREAFTLDGSGSLDSDDGIASFVWTQLSGGPATELPLYDPAAAQSISPQAPSLTSVANTLKFQLTVTDKGSLSRSADCEVAVQDITPPLISETVNLTVEATSAAGAAAAFEPTATDNVDGVVAVTCAPASGGEFPLGKTSVSCGAADRVGNAAVAGFIVTVQDTTPPVVTPPADITMEATGKLTAMALGAAAATDAVGVVGIINDAPAAFPVDTTTVTWTARDAAGNAGSAAQKVTVTDTTPPALSNMPVPLPFEATGPEGAVVTFASPLATDLVDGAVAVTCVPASGSTFALGTGSVSCSAVDVHANSARKSFAVTVQDTTPPALSNVPANIKTFAASAAGTAVTYEKPKATDLVDGSVAVDCALASGSIFPVGTTAVKCSAIDAHKNVSAAGFSVQVEYNWNGFFSPVNNGLVNKVKAGSAIPIKFSLGGNMGLNIFAAGYPSSVTGSSLSEVLVNDLTEMSVTAGGSSLTYDPLANQYIYVWKTDKNWGGSSRQLQLMLQDGTIHVVNFSFTK